MSLLHKRMKTLNLTWLCCCLVAKSCPTLATPWTVAHQATLSMGFPRQEYWCELSFPTLGESSQCRDQIQISCIDRWILYHWATREVQSGLGFITNTQMHLFARLTSVSNLFWSSWCYSPLLLGYCFSLVTSSRFRDHNPSTA